jgi:hypothetical protein
MINKIKNMLTPYDLGLTKIRLGPKQDGGYVVYKEPLEKTKLVYSLGIGWVSQTEYDLCLLGKKVKMYDCDPYNGLWHKNMEFKQIFVDSKFFNSELDPIEDNDLMLCMDIEGSEYELLSNIKNKNLLKFSQINFELHYLWTNPNKELFNILEKLNKNYVLFHIHGNNCGPEKEGLPDVVELSFLRKDMCKQITKENINYPILGLDFSNDPHDRNKPDYILNWWSNE